MVGGQRPSRRCRWPAGRCLSGAGQAAAQSGNDWGDTWLKRRDFIAAMGGMTAGLWAHGPMAAPRAAGMLRTPESRFVNLPGYAFLPHYVELPDPRFSRLRMHYVDEGPRQGPVMLLLHGQGTWAYHYRRMITILARTGYRVIVPDYLGFGRSDKLINAEDYSFQRYVDWLEAFMTALQLRDVTAFMFDWGGYFGLRLAAERPEFFGRLALSNTMLPKGLSNGRDWFLKWREKQLQMPVFPQGDMVNDGVVNKLSSEVIEAYDAPYPDETYKAGPRRLPMILPIFENDPASIANKAAWDKLATWRKPVVTLFSSRGAGMRPEPLQAHIPGAAGQNHVLIENAGFYIVEDQSELLAKHLYRFSPL